MLEVIIHPEKTETQKDTCVPMISTLFTTVRTLKQPKCPSTGEQIKKMSYTQATEYYSAIKKKNWVNFRNMDGPRVRYTE